MTRGLCPFAEWIPGVTAFSRGFLARVGFCDHTAGGYMGTMRRASFWNEAGVSAHFAISKRGEIIQLVNIFDTAFAQGRLGPISWPQFQTMQRQTGMGPNSWLISTEHEDEASVPIWTPEMYEADLRVKRWCIEECAREGHDLLRFGLDSLTGHFMFDGRDRPNCPGPYWPRERLYHDLTESEDDMPNPVWATWKDLPPGAPYRSYLLYFKADGSFTKRHVRSAEEHMALYRIYGADPVELPLEDLRLFAGGPEPNDP